MPGVGLMVRVVGLGSEDPEFKSHSDVELILLWSRASVASTTARWSSRVDSAEHPEFRSYLSENYRTVNRQ